jgi:glutamate-5-semialdehyde dehydrogenase
MCIKQKIQELGAKAKKASVAMRTATTKQKNDALYKIAEQIEKNRNELITANEIDIKKAHENKLQDSLVDRLKITHSGIDGMIDGLKKVASLPDIVGEISNINQQPSGIKVGKMRTPLGVIAIIYESRPNVTIDASALCIKSGNACILRGGSEAFHSNQKLAQIIKHSLKHSDLNEDAVLVVDTTDRKAVDEMITMKDFIDVVIPRGGKSLVKKIDDVATVPVIKHLDGICHVYIDEFANIKKAVDIAFNSKTHRYGVCNAMETLLVHKDVAQEVLVLLIPKLKSKNVEIRGCDLLIKLFADSKIVGAKNEDWSSEYLAPILSIKIIDSIDDAVEHINKYGSHHTDAIVTQDYSNSQRFLVEVDSSSVIVNASTRFADGYEFGLGAEIGISTDKIHARGPVGLEGLTSQKYIVFGDGNLR